MSIFQCSAVFMTPRIQRTSCRYTTSLPERLFTSLSSRTWWYITSKLKMASYGRWYTLQMKWLVQSCSCGHRFAFLSIYIVALQLRLVLFDCFVCLFVWLFDYLLCELRALCELLCVALIMWCIIMMMDQAMFCEWNECESEDCPRKHEMPQDVKNLGGGRRKTPGGGVVARTYNCQWCP